MKLVTLKKEYNLLLKETITDYLNPNYIYLPISNNTNLNVNPKSYIYRGEEILNYVYSPVSGKIVGLQERECVTGKSKFIVIENDFKEKTKERLGVRKNLSKISKEELFKYVSTYDKNLYNKMNKDFSKIIVSGIEEQPYIGNYMFINVNYTKEILDMLDSLGDILNINNIDILLKDTDYNSINSFNNIIGMFNNVCIKFLPDKFLISKEEILNKYLNITDNYLYLNIEEVYDLYQYLKRHKVKEEKIITITGDAVDNPQVVKCKLGTLLSELINGIVILKTDEFVVIENSLLNYKPINYNYYVVDENLRAIYIMKKQKIVENKCIKCGKCNEVCPMKIKVSNLVSNKKCNIDDCIHCGLCSYICPSFININKYLDGDKNE